MIFIFYQEHTHHRIHQVFQMTSLVAYTVLS